MKNEVRIVGTFEYQEGKLVSVDQNRRLFDAHKAVPIPANQIGIYYPLKTASSLKVGSGFTSITLRSGETYPAAISARRVILEVSRERVIFVEHSSSQRVPSFFIQTPYGFHQQWLDVIRRDAASKTAAAVVLAEWEVQFLVGAIAGASWTGLAVVIGVDMLEEAMTRKKTKATKEAVRVIQVLAAARRELIVVAPTLTEVVSDMVWLTLLGGQQQFLVSEMAKDPKVAARAAGTIVVQLGKQALDQRLTVTSFIWATLSQVGVKGALTVPVALGKTIDHLSSTEPEAIIDNIEVVLRDLNIVLTPQKKQAILGELRAEPVKIPAIFAKMIKQLSESPQ